jgi:hypothetical protein
MRSEGNENRAMKDSEKGNDWAGFCNYWQRWLRRTLVRHSFMRRRTSTAFILFSLFNLLWLYLSAKLAVWMLYFCNRSSIK